MSAILDRNLSELLRRHRPVVADPLFRERLGARFVAAALDAARPAAAPVARPAPARPVLRRAALLAAAGLLALFSAWWLVEGGGAPRSKLDELLARTGAASREQRDGDWHAAGASRLALAGDYLEAADAGRTELAVELPGLGEAALLAGTPARASFERESDAVRVRVVEGRVALRRDGASTELPAGHSALVSPASTLALPTLALDAPRPLAPSSTPTVAEAAPEPPPAPGELRGRVVRAEDGTPVTDALLILATTDITSDGPKTVLRDLHDPEGRFRWSPPPGRYHFYVQADGFAASITRNVLIDARLLLPDLLLELERGVTVSGTVLDATSGAPVAGALVISDTDAPAIMISLRPEYLKAENDREIIRNRVLTDADGHFELPHLSARGQVLRASSPKLAPAWLTVPAGPASDVTLRLPPAGSVQGRVLRDGIAWEQALVVASFNCPEPSGRAMALGVAFTDADGHYRINGLPPLMGVVLMIGDPDASPGLPPMQAVQIEAGQVASVDFGQPRPGGAELSGHLSEADGAPATGRLLSLSPLDGNPKVDWTGSMVDDAGDYHFEHLPAGGFDVFVDFGTSGEVSYLTRIELLRDEVRRLDLQLAGGGLSGHAMAADGTPLVGANVIVWRATDAGHVFASRALVDENGAWLARALPAGRYDFAIYDARGRWAAARRDGVEVADVVVAGLDTTQAEGGHLVVHVADGAGAPLANTLVTLHDADGRAWDLAQTMVTGADGTLRLDGVPAGTWEVSVAGPGLAGTRRVEVAAGQDVELSFPPAVRR